MMQIALGVAARGLGRMDPNPAVGARVIAHERTGATRPLAGWTPRKWRAGQPAETEAIARAGVGAGGATMYVTLEPALAPWLDGAVRRRHRRCRAGACRVRHQGLRSARRRPRAGAPSAGGHRGRARLASRARASGSPPVTSCGLRSGDRWSRRSGSGRSHGSVPGGGAGHGDWAATGPAARAAGHLMRAHADAILVGRRARSRRR